MQMRDIEIEQKETINRSQKCIERMRRGSAVSVLAMPL